MHTTVHEFLQIRAKRRSSAAGIRIVIISELETTAGATFKRSVTESAYIGRIAKIAEWRER